MSERARRTIIRKNAFSCLSFPHARVASALAQYACMAFLHRSTAEAEPKACTRGRTVGAAGPLHEPALETLTSSGPHPILSLLHAPHPFTGGCAREDAHCASSHGSSRLGGRLPRCRRRGSRTAMGQLVVYGSRPRRRRRAAPHVCAVYPRTLQH